MLVGWSLDLRVNDQIMFQELITQVTLIITITITGLWLFCICITDTFYGYQNTHIYNACKFYILDKH